jgi:probable aminopeptidase NPEPL1
MRPFASPSQHHHRINSPTKAQHKSFLTLCDGIGDRCCLGLCLQLPGIIVSTTTLTVMIRIFPRHIHHSLIPQLGLTFFLLSSHYPSSALSLVRGFTTTTTSVVVAFAASPSHTVAPAKSRSHSSSSSIFRTSLSSGIFGMSNSNRKMMLSATSTSTSTTTFSLDEPSSPVHTTMLIGKKKVLQDLLVESNKNAANGTSGFCADLDLDASTAQAVLYSIDGTSGAASTFCSSGTQKLVLGVIPDETSRNNHAWSVHAVTEMVAAQLPAGKTSRVVFVGNDDSAAVDHVGALTIAVSKAFSAFSEKTTTASRKNDVEKMQEELAKKQRVIYIQFCNEQGKILTVDAPAATAALAAADGVQLAARLVDMPPDQLTTDAYAAECQVIAESLGDCVSYTEIQGDELQRLGYGGLYAVGMAATCPPRLVILEYTPPPSSDSASDSNDETSKKVIALVGKSIVYDTGGLAIKSRDGMCGMKVDMGGSAGLLGAFCTAVRSGYTSKLYLVLCIAENAIGPTSFRNDDILRLYSGKTVEINNSDAEGRLVLGDGVAHATRHFEKLDLVIDMATLTGAQMVCTGRKHASILANTVELEQQAVQAGLRSGDLCYPVLYAPELLMKEFKSKVADMKNSVKDRNNAQASCAGHFVEAHLDEDYKGGWIHVDMAGPAVEGERGTGYGVGLVLSLLGVQGF